MGVGSEGRFLFNDSSDAMAIADFSLCLQLGGGGEEETFLTVPPKPVSEPYFRHSLKS